MAKIVKRERCSYCRKTRRFEGERWSSLLHLVLAVFTAGLWIPVWFVVICLPVPRYCSECGERHGYEMAAWAWAFVKMVLIAVGIVAGTLVAVAALTR